MSVPANPPLPPPAASFYEGGAPIVTKAAPEDQIPHELYNFIVFKCFDACIGNFENKTLDNQEHHCVEECVTNLKEPPHLYQKSQQYHGFMT